MRYTVRQSHHARNPEIFRPKISATADRCPSEPILPSALNAKVLRAVPRIVAAMFAARHFASRIAC